MTTLTITTKGQVTFKQGLLKHLGVEPGQKIEVDKLPDGKILVKAAGQTDTIESFIGCLSQHALKDTLTIDRINTIAAQSWAGEP